MERKDVNLQTSLSKVVLNSPLMFAEFGLDRTIESWVDPDFSKPVLHLGPGKKHIDGTIEYDWPKWDFDKLDSSNPFKTGARFPYGDGEVGGIIATHVLEHLRDPLPLLREASRILAFGCPFSILVPHGESLMFKQDLDHKTPFVIETWKTLLENPYYTKGKDGLSFRLGANFLFGVKEANLALVTQLIKR